MPGSRAICSTLAKATIAKQKAGEKDAFYENKLITGKLFLARMLPDTKSHLAKLKTGAEPLMAMAADAF